jgi:peroxiredoxin-like protein
MTSYPLYFDVSAKAHSGISTSWKSGSSQFESPIAIPPEFGGPGGGFSPEDIYAMALTNCFIATFKVIAERSKADFESIEIASKLTVDRSEGGNPWMKAITMKVKVTGTKDASKVERLLQKTSTSCLILNSVKTEKTLEFTVL